MVTHLKTCGFVDEETVKKALSDRQSDVEERRSPVRSPTISSPSPSPPVQSHPGHLQASTSEPSIKRQKTWREGLSGNVVQAEFADDIARLWIATGMPWATSEHPEVKSFVKKWCPPEVHVPHRETLSGTLLDRAVEKAVEKVRDKVKGGLATGECDGWKNGSRTPVETSMMTVANEVSARTYMS